MLRNRLLTLIAAAGIALSSIAITAAPAEAGWRRGYAGGGYARPYRTYARPSYVRRPAYWYGGCRYGGCGYGAGAGAAAAGLLIGALALGAVAAASQPEPVYAAPYGYAPPPPPYGYAPQPLPPGFDTNGNPICVGGPSRC